MDLKESQFPRRQFVFRQKFAVREEEEEGLSPSKIDLHKHCLLMLLANEKTFTTTYRHISNL